MLADDSIGDGLWVCHECERIGSEPAAERHMEQTGHAIEKLTDAEAVGVRELWAKEGRRPDGGEWSTLAGELLMYAQIRREAQADVVTVRDARE